MSLLGRTSTVRTVFRGFRSGGLFVKGSRIEEGCVLKANCFLLTIFLLPESFCRMPYDPKNLRGKFLKSVRTQTAIREMMVTWSRAWHQKTRLSSGLRRPSLGLQRAALSLPASPNWNAFTGHTIEQLKTLALLLTLFAFGALNCAFELIVYGDLSFEDHWKLRKCFTNLNEQKLPLKTITKTLTSPLSLEVFSALKDQTASGAHINYVRA